MEKHIQRIELLFSQNRFKDAEVLLRELLDAYPDLEYVQYLLSISLTNQGKHSEAYEIVLIICGLNPGELSYLELKAEIELALEDIENAEDTVNHLIKSDAQNDNYYFLLARIKFNVNNYDKALEYCNLALSINPDNIGALNLSLTINSQLGNVDVARQRVAEALQRNPENPFTIANHGLSLLNEGKTKLALEKFKEALSLNPNNEIAQYGMQEALKSRFWPYKMLYQFGLLLSRLSGRNAWFFIIGSYVGLRILSNLAQKSPALKPFLIPIIAVIAFLFAMTWLLDPIMNIYLLSNKYGRILLDKHTKLAAQISAVSFGLAILSILTFLMAPLPLFIYATIFFIAMVIPIGTMFKPLKEKNRKTAVYMTSAIGIIGILGLLLYAVTKSVTLIYLSFFGIFAYQWIINGMLISDSSRRFGD